MFRKNGNEENANDRKNLNKKKGGNNRLIFQKWGMKLEPICKNKSHDRSRLAFVCTYPKCEGESRFGCALCFLEKPHKEHSDNKIKIEKFMEIMQDEYEHDYAPIFNSFRLNVE